VVPEPTSLSAAVGNPTGGDPYTDHCPADQVLTGFPGLLSSSGWLAHIQAHCAALVVSADAPYTVSSAATSTTPMHGEQGDVTQPWTSLCLDGAVVVGFGGREGSFFDQLIVYCAPILVSGSPGNFTFSLGADYALPPAGGSGGTPFPRADCPPDEVAQGVNLRTGYHVDSIQLICGALAAP
jgi:hypothetical protein